MFKPVSLLFDQPTYMYIALGQWQTPPGGNFLINIIIQSILSFAASLPALNDFATVFPFKRIGDTI